MSPSHESVPWALLDRYLAGELNADEQETMRRWMAADPGAAAILAAARRARDVGASPAPEWDLGRMWAGVVRDTARAGDPVVPSRPRWGKAWVAGAAVAAALVLAIGGVVVSGVIPQLSHERVYATRAGERQTLTLEDGTIVTLGPASRMRVAIAAERREVRLEGEGFFSVVHDAGRPFRVHAGNAVATDVGTRFMVRRYLDDTAVRVVVADGAVALGDRTTLTHGMLGVVGRDGATRVTAGVDVAAAMAWTDGALVFDRVPLRVVAGELGRWYDVEIRFADPAMGEELVTTSLKDETLTEVLTALSASLALDATRQGRVVTFTQTERHR
jgi:transmembrane sensor